VCDCCLGITVRTPRSVANGPGRPALQYRVGEYGDFLSSMLAALGRQVVPADEAIGSAALLGRLAAPSTGIGDLRPLAGLRTRAADDPTIALLDAWAVTLDVLSFYQERIANEGYLGTATEFRSVLELARLVGYDPRPGVAASTFLAYTLDPGGTVTIRAGSRAQSVPGAGELPQSFETKADLLARADWNSLAPRAARPQQFEPGQTTAGRRVWLDGLGTQLKPNDPLLLVFDAARGQPFRVKTVELENADQRTRVVLQDFRTEPPLVSDSEALQAARQIIGDALQSFDESGMAGSLEAPNNIEPIIAELRTLVVRNPDTPEALMTNLQSLVG
jgi:hypothetical protein